jgi:thioredoxin reductase (NADPH)
MIYDVAIIGGGPAGLTAGLYASRSRLKTILFEKLSSGGQIALTSSVENYPGIESINGFDLSQVMEKQARNFGTEIVNSEIGHISKNSDGLFELRSGESAWLSRTVIAATGSMPRKLNVEGEDRLLSRGVSYCAVCDGAFFKEKMVAVIGGGNTAVEEAVYLTRYARKVYVIHRRGELRAVKIVQERAFANPKIEFIWNAVVEKISGDKKVTGITVRDVRSGKASELPLEGVFVYVGTQPYSGIYKDLSELDERGYVKTDKDMKTRTPGLFAAGDVRDKNAWQVSIAVGDGSLAALMAEKYITEVF